MISFGSWFSPNEIGILLSFIFVAHSNIIDSLYAFVNAPKYDIIPDDINISPIIFFANVDKLSFFFFHSSFSLPNELFNIFAFFKRVVH